MKNANSGYVGYSMSVRAQEAYSEGLVPVSKLKAAELKVVGISLTLPFVKWLIQQGVLQSEEWHHTGKWFNETHFYSYASLRDQIAELDVETWRKTYEEERQSALNEKAAAKGVYVDVEYREWSGSRRYGRYETKRSYGYLWNGWIHLDDTKKKKADSENVTILKTYARKPKEWPTAIRDAIFRKIAVSQKVKR